MTSIYTTPPYFTNRVSELTTLALVADDLLAGRLAPPQALGTVAWTRDKLLARTRTATQELINLFARQGILLADPA